ncbi:hypothetical protein NPIL_534571 [Nephila pilipes]|uniref:Uncharacterized protein n=1 Tax=Nephila pilipes TaxID=299642 RepID=A0A8X6QYE8_NEPPI|nr:hypothetical protein NPIL_534571 [Nephila pilipes]
MVSPQEKKHAVLWFVEYQWAILMQQFRREFHKVPPQLHSMFARKTNTFPHHHHLHPSITYQHDDAPPQWSLHIRKALNVTSLSMQIQYHSTTTWPLHSPDITPLTFFLWGSIKNKFFLPQQ